MDSRYLPTQYIPSSTSFPKIKQLSLKAQVRSAVSDSAHFICHCPNLTHLEIESVDMYGDPGSIELLVTPVIKPLLGQLKKLLISGMPDGLTARFWRELPVASCLSAIYYGPECHQLLVSPTNRTWACQIREINIRGGLYDNSRNVSEVLMICFGLRKFETSYIEVNDTILNPVIPVDYSSRNLRPWGCLELEELRAEFICLSSRSQHKRNPVERDVYEFSSLVFTQIAALKHLRHLDLEPIIRNDRQGCTSIWSQYRIVVRDHLNVDLWSQCCNAF
ncbi:hypothetical protein BG005_007147 [Podila minutissima]|nr:hypothetical protein BG005_007147 [Podila minutissima]